MSQLTNNTTTLQAILDAVNALPEAGSGEAIETCTVTVNHDATADSRILSLQVVVLEDGIPVMKTAARSQSGNTYGDFDFAESSITIENVVCNTNIAITVYMSSLLPGFVGDKAMNTYGFFGFPSATVIRAGAFELTAAAGETATITIYDAD